MITANGCSSDVGLSFINANTSSYSSMMSGAASFADSLGDSLQKSGATADGAGLTVSFTEETDEGIMGTGAAGTSGTSAASSESDTAFGAAGTDSGGASQIDATGSQLIAVQEWAGGNGPGGGPGSGYGVAYGFQETESVTLHFDNAAQMAAELPQFIGSMQQRLGGAEQQLDNAEAQTPISGAMNMGYQQWVTLNVTAGPSDAAPPTAQYFSSDDPWPEAPDVTSGTVFLIPADAPPDISAGAAASIINGSTFSSTTNFACLLDQPENSASSSNAAAGNSSASDDDVSGTGTDLFKDAAAKDAELMHADLRMKDSQTLQAEIQALFGGSSTV